MEEPICLLELSSSGVKLLVGYVYNNIVYVLHAMESTRAKLVRGNIEDKGEMTIAIKELINTASNGLKIHIDKVVLVVPSFGLKVYPDKGETNTTESRVSLFDATNCETIIKKSVARKTKPNEKIFDVNPYEYVLENNVEYSKIPFNTLSDRLLMYADVLTMEEGLLKNYKSVVTDAGLKILKVVNAATAAVKFINSSNSNYAQFIFIDIGARTTTLGYATESRLLNVETLNFGSDDITEAIMNEFGISFEDANHYKEVYGLCKDPSFMFETKDHFKLSDLNEVIVKSLEPLVKGIQEFILSFDRSAQNVFMITGGGSSLLGLDSFLAKTFKNKVLSYTPVNYGARNRSYANLVASVKYYDDCELKNAQSRPSDLTLTRVFDINDLSDDDSQTSELDDETGEERL